MSSSFKVDADAIRELALLLSETGLSEIEVEDAGQRLRVARNLVAPAVPGAVVSTSQPMPAEGETQLTNAETDANHPGAVASPMVGTAYLSPEPGAAAFVKPGDQISEGETLLIVEAMKVMNPIRAPKDGTISRVLIENGSPVEYGQLLMILD